MKNCWNLGVILAETMVWITLLLKPVAVFADSTCTYTEHWSLPQWFLPASQLSEPYEVSCRLNPFYLTGDFDGDGQQDLAVLITNANNNKHGIAIALRVTSRPTILGAGVPFDEDDGDFSWLDVWRVEPRPVLPNAGREPVPDYRGEVLYLEKSESASGWVGFVDDRIVWYQAGD